MEWLTDPEGRCQGLRLVHHIEIGRLLGGCSNYNKSRERARMHWDMADLPLSEFLGPDGLMDLIHMREDPDFADCGIAEMTKRLHIPGYEEARHHFADAIAADYFPAPSTAGNYSQQDIEAVRAYLKNQPDRAAIPRMQVKGLATSASPRPARIEAWWKDNGPNATPRFSGEAGNRFGWNVAASFQPESSK